MSNFDNRKSIPQTDTSGSKRPDDQEYRSRIGRQQAHFASLTPDQLKRAQKQSRSSLPLGSNQQDLTQEKDETQNSILDTTQNGLETTGPAILESASPEVEQAYQAVMRHIKAQDFEGAAKLLKALSANLGKAVLEKILGKAPKTSFIKLTAEQLMDILKSSLGKIPKAVLDMFNKMKPMKGSKEFNANGRDEGAYIGTEVHKEIAKNYQFENPADSVITNYVSISTILKERFPSADVSAVGKGTLKKPDILNVTKRHLYEIKTEASATAAVIERDEYIEWFKLAGVAIERGPSDAPGANGVVKAPGGYAVYYSPAPGVILYRKRNGDFDPKLVPIAATKEEQEKNKQEQPSRQSTPALASSGLSPELESLRLSLGLSLEAFVLYLIFSEGSRILFPPRNLLPIP
jgi:hypothetical protein